jgi:regulator of sigma E protease
MDILVNWLQQGLIAVVPFIVLLGILIFVHELGHFLVARWCGVRVEIFSLGFGKKIFSYKKGDTTYCISIVPLGGYVKMFGEQPGENIPPAQKKYSFTHKNVYKRIAIVLAGPLMNFFFAVLIFWALAMIGEEFHRPLLGDIERTSPAYKMGLRSGDLITGINGKDIKTFEEVVQRLTDHRNRDVLVTVQRDDGTVDLAATVSSKPNPNILSVNESVGDITGMTLLSRGTFVGVEPSSPLYKIGLRPGDRIVNINGTKVTYWRELDKVLKSVPTSSPLTLEVERFLDDKFQKSEKMSLTYSGSKLKEYSLDTLGMESSELYLAKISADSPASEAGLQRFDKIVSIDNKEVTAWDEVVNIIKNFDGSSEALIFDIRREGKPLSLKIKPAMTTQMSPTGAEDKRFTVGVYPMVNFADAESVVIRADNIGQALVRGVTRTWDVSVMMAMSFVRLVENKISAKNIGGVISIGQAASETFKMGLDKFLQMMALISVNLFILNLLPIPVLDGGHLVFYVIEAVKGSPLSLKKMEMAQQVGLVLLMSLMVFALFNDITRIFSAH